jgi:hypothetical protein
VHYRQIAEERFLVSAKCARRAIQVRIRLFDSDFAKFMLNRSDMIERSQYSQLTAIFNKVVFDKSHKATLEKKAFVRVAAPTTMGSCPLFPRLLSTQILRTG